MNALKSPSPMKVKARSRREAAPASANGGHSADTRQRVLESACHLFSEKGFRGTHVRDVCKRAGVNIPAAWHYFPGKEKLYGAVVREAYRRMADRGCWAAEQRTNSRPDQTLRAVVESLFERLGADGAWIARLLARELFESYTGPGVPVGAGLGADMVLLQAAVRKLLGTRAVRDRVRLCSLTILSQCVFYVLAEARLHRAFPQLLRPMPPRPDLVQHIVAFAVDGLKPGKRA